jgi:pimeloyl-ACP methyl ester carboxylesterase
MPLAWRLADLMPFLAAALDELGLERVTRVGLSLGGAVALGFTLRWPIRVERLILADSYGLGGSVDDSYGRFGALGTRLFLGVPGLNALTWRLLASAVSRSRAVRGCSRPGCLDGESRPAIR